MRGLEWGKGVVRCGFCGDEGHNITSCKHVPSLYKKTKYDKRATGPDGVPLTGQEQPWVLLENWWRLTRQEQKAWVEMTNREKRLSKRSSRKLKKRKQRCSFCRKEGHRRPSCRHYKKFSKTMYKANAVWRKQFVDLINITGMGIGSLVEIPKSTMFWWSDNGERILCLVVGYTMEKLNVFSSYNNGRSGSEFKTVPQLILADTKTGDEIKIGFDKVKPFVSSGLVTSNWSTDFIKVISPVGWKPSKEWYREEVNEELDYVLKKLSVVSDQFVFVNGFINIWNKGVDNE